jgi:hypothetical protein
MKKLLAALIVISFILWILPLGYFIKPSQEKLVCDGQRAICMCYMVGHKSPDKAMEPGIALKAGSSSNKENSSGGGANYFISTKPIVALNLQFASFFKDQYLCYKNPFLTSLEPVPKN